MGGLVALGALVTACERAATQPPEAVTKLSPEQMARAAQAADAGSPAQEVIPEPAQPRQGVAAATLDAGSAEQQDLLLRAKSLYLNDRFQAAKPLLRELAQSEPLSGPVVSATIALGDILAQEGKDAEAITLYHALVKRDVQVAEVQLVIARAYQRLGAAQAALTAYEHALRLEPYYIFIHAERGVLLAQLGQNEESAKAFLDYEGRIYDLAKQLGDTAQVPQRDRIAIADTFSFIEDDRVTQALIKTARVDPSDLVRQRAIRALAEVRAKSALQALEELYTLERDPQLMQALKESIDRLKALPTQASDDVSAPTLVPPAGP